MASIGRDGADAIFWDAEYGWAVQWTGKRSNWRREYLGGHPVDPAEKNWSIQKVAKLAADVVPKDEMFVFPFSRNAKKTMQGSIIINNGKVTSTSSSK